MTRDPSRIDPILSRLRAAWQRSPDLRLGQLIVGSIPIGHLDRADAIRRLFNAECHEFGASGAPVEWPAPPTAQPPPVLDLDALAEDVTHLAKLDLVGELRGLVSAAPHLIAEARAAVALRIDKAALVKLIDENDRRGAKVEALTAELAAARAVPPDVEAEIDRHGLAAFEAGNPSPTLDAATKLLKAAIARAISDATAATRADLAAAVHELGELARAYHVADDAIGEVCRLVGAESSPGAADVAGNDASRKRDAVAKVRALVEASKAVPDVEAAIDARDAEWQNRIMPFHKGFDGDGCESGDPIDWTLSALSQAKCTVEDAVGDFIEGHAKRLCDAAGGVWHDEYDSWASQVHDVLNHLRADADGAVIDGRASKPATVGGLLATAPVGAIVEWLDGDGDWNQAVACVDDRIPCAMHRWWMAGRWCQYGGFDDAGRHLRLPARLVPAHLADADPASRGEIASIAPRCSCTREAGDSRCDAHPSCSECGDRTARNVDDCADHCQACASLRRGDVISITSAAAMCSACKARGPIGEVPDVR